MHDRTWSERWGSFGLQTHLIETCRALHHVLARTWTLWSTLPWWVLQLPLFHVPKSKLHGDMRSLRFVIVYNGVQNFWQLTWGIHFLWCDRKCSHLVWSYGYKMLQVLLTIILNLPWYPNTSWIPSSGWHLHRFDLRKSTVLERLCSLIFGMSLHRIFSSCVVCLAGVPHWYVYIWDWSHRSLLCLVFVFLVVVLVVVVVVVVPLLVTQWPPLTFLRDTLLLPTQVGRGLCRDMRCELLRFSLICSRHWHSSMAPSLPTTMLRPTMRSCFFSATLGADLDKTLVL